MSYCTTTELENLTGSGLSTTILLEIIDQADREIKARLAAADIAAPDSNDYLKTASLNLGMVGIIMRMRIDGSKPTAYTLGDLTIRDDDVRDRMDICKKNAQSAIDAYIRSCISNRQYYYIRKVNA